MGNERFHTPNLDRLAAQSARFTNGYVPSSVCRPPLVSLLTGLYPHQHGIHFNHGPPGSAGYNRIASADAYVKTRQREFELIRKQKTLAGILQAEAGYRCLQTGTFWEGHWRNGGFIEGRTIFKAPPRPAPISRRQTTLALPVHRVAGQRSVLRVISEQVTEAMQQVWHQGFDALQSGSLDPRDLAAQVANAATGTDSPPTGLSRGEEILKMWKLL